MRPGVPRAPEPAAGKGGLVAHVPWSPGHRLCRPPGPPLLAHGPWAGMQAHTSRRSRERGLGQTQSLRSRSNVAVQQVLGTHPGTGRRSPTGVHVHPHRGDPSPSCWEHKHRLHTGPPGPAQCTGGGLRPQLWLRRHEAATRAQRRGMPAPSPLPWGLGRKFDSEEDFPAGLLCHQQDVARFPEAQPGT